ncbi:hypothetical protein J4E08_11870 [Sagittula sp. NFXS13]|uniref:O-antigen ligase n=1 Tax=Sagittula marina TaxID=943940 RepID=A0A7W6DQ75_9RHOB|nr:hypothetical protein [Sagittula marina]MBB3986799.1 O-antigen ligase [Sagittula marina]
MPVTSFALLVLSALVALVLALWALSSWGALTVLGVILGLVLFGLWAAAPMPNDDSTT